MIERAAQLDALAFWDSFMQQYLLEEVCPAEVTVGRLQQLEPYRWQENPWSAALREKRVLVVHPFARTIESQYSKRELLFDNPETLPDFQLQTLIPPQTIAGNKDDRFADWFEALAWLERETDARDFDVAIIGCGAYGFPLAAHVKETGRQAIHLAGATQLLFGIKGKRWDDDPEADWLYNPHWVRPSQDERPPSASLVEGGCYW